MLLQVGKSVLIRTVSYFQVGKVTKIENGFVQLEKASWVANTGRFSSCLTSGEFEEVEVIPGSGSVMINAAAIVDVFEWNHPIPTQTK